jgi:hypothetical protein
VGLFGAISGHDYVRLRLYGGRRNAGKNSRPNNVYQHRNTQHPDNVTEQAANGTEGVEGYFRHTRRSAITRSTPIRGVPAEPALVVAMTPLFLL